MATQPQVTEPEVKNTEPQKDEATGKFIHIYQPRDAEGQFIGKPYRFLYTDHMDLVRQIEQAKEHADRFIYEVKTGKRQVKGEPAEPKPEYKPVQAADEDSAKRREQARKDLEAELGAPLDSVRETLKRANDFDEYLIANTWALANEANGYYICPQNGRAMDKYLKDNKLRVSAANLTLAFEELKDTLVQKPQEQQTTADSTQQQPTRAEVKPQSTGIIPGQFQGTRPQNATERKPLTAERFREINRMSRDQWKKLERANPKEAEAFLAMRYAQPQ